MFSDQLPGVLRGVWRLQKSPEEAYAALLGSSALYGDGGPLICYGRGAVSLPDDVSGSPFVTSVMGATRKYG